mgnify:CR=1 FL=1
MVLWGDGMDFERAGGAVLDASARDDRRRRSRRIRALLATGLVFGAGASPTLAAWTETEHAGARLTAGTFGLVGSANGSDFTDHPSPASAATLSFGVAPTNMMPGDTTYALYAVKASGSVDGVVQLVAGVPGGTGLAAHLRYGVKVLAGTTCDAGTYAASSAVVVPDGSPLTASGSGARAVTAGGPSVNYCFAVTLPQTAPDDAQGRSGSQTWRFVGSTG